MAAPVLSVETEHEDMIHDAQGAPSKATPNRKLFEAHKSFVVQLDYYSRMLATASSDRTVRIFDVAGDVYQPKFVIRGHEGPVWQVAWSHPKFGILASCSYDGTVRLYREKATGGEWESGTRVEFRRVPLRELTRHDLAPKLQQIHVHSGHNSSVNSISFAPHEFGLILACASADGKISVLEHCQTESAGSEWKCTPYSDSPLGVNTVCWAPFSSGQKRFVTGGCDNKARIWSCDDKGNWTMEMLSEDAHNDWVRDVAWAPSTGLPLDMIATASEDRTVRIWTKGPDGTWGSVLLNVFDFPVWRVSWSITGNILAVSAGDSDVTLWKQSADASWAQISSVDDEGFKN